MTELIAGFLAGCVVALAAYFLTVRPLILKIERMRYAGFIGSPPSLNKPAEDLSFLPREE